MTNQPSWLQLVCHTNQEHHQAIEEQMENAKALSITLNDAGDTPVLEPLPGEIPLWDDLIISALFDADTNLDNLSKTLNENKSRWNISDFFIEKVEDQDWERVWMSDYHPMQFGDKLWIYPSNHEIPDDDSIKIQLDPGLAFGTGTHPTTALCLEWLDNNPPHNKTVIDYGCGSGILAIAAAKLGAKSIIATDIDPQALTATLDNMQRNQIPNDRIKCYLPQDFPHQATDLLLANILCGPLHELYELFSALTLSGGKLVLSGILEQQKDQLIDSYSHTFTHFKVETQENWVRIEATKV